MKGFKMKKSAIIVAALAVLFVVGKDANKQKEIDDLKARIDTARRVNDLYHETLEKSIKKLDREDRRELVQTYNENLKFIHLTHKF
jgi:hypothetical protein